LTVLVGHATTMARQQQQCQRIFGRIGFLALVLIKTMLTNQFNRPDAYDWQV
jgi:hypothetical protein